MTDKKNLDNEIELISAGTDSRVREIQVIFPHMTGEELSQLETVARASQDQQSEMNRMLARVC